MQAQARTRSAAPSCATCHARGCGGYRANGVMADNVAAQGAAPKRAGRLYVRQDGDEIRVGGNVVEVVGGEIGL